MNKLLLEIISKHTGENLLEIKEIKGNGQVNSVFVVSTNVSKYVIRIDPNESTIDRFEKESWCTNEALKVGVFGPKVFGIGIKDDHPYMLLSYIEGIHGEETDHGEKINIWFKLGEYARKIHSIKVEGYGERMTQPGVFDGSWIDFLDYNISSLNTDDKLLISGFITSKQSELIKSIFLKLKTSNFNFGLVHHDLSLKNTILTPDKNIYLIDWGSAEVNIVPHIDFGQVLRSSLNKKSVEFKAFLNGYKMNQKQFEAIETDIARLRLLNCIDKVRWTLDRKPELTESKVKELQELIESFNLEELV